MGHQRRAAMVVDDALRVAGRARRVVERDGVPFVVRHGPGEVGVAGLHEGFVVERADPLALRVGGIRRVVRIVIVDHQRLHPGDRQRLAHDARELAVDDQHLRFGMIELEGDDGRVEPRVERMQDRLHHRHAEMRFQHGRRIGQHDGDGIALADARSGERRGELQRTAPEIAIGQPQVAMNHRDLVRIGLGGALKQGKRRQRLVVGGVAVEADLIDVGQGIPPGEILCRAILSRFRKTVPRFSDGSLSQDKQRNLASHASPLGAPSLCGSNLLRGKGRVGIKTTTPSRPTAASRQSAPPWHR